MKSGIKRPCQTTKPEFTNQSLQRNTIMTRSFIPPLALLLALCATALQAAEVSVAVASNFAAPMQKIAAAFEQDTGHKTLLAFGSTGKFYAQIRNGAPFEVLLAADDETPQRLERERLGVPGSRYTYALGRLALYSARPGVVDDKGQVLATGDFARLALSDPKVAPYGAAAVETMTRLGQWPRWQAKLVQGESVGQTFQFVATGNAALGFVALSQVMMDGRIASGSAWVVPHNLHTPLKQDLLVLKVGASNPAALALADYLKGEKARGIMRGYGYEFE